jgi:hypothetical protein
MKETNLAQKTANDVRPGDEAAQPMEIRQLDELELALAGGGEDIVTWP